MSLDVATSLDHRRHSSLLLASLIEDAYTQLLLAFDSSTSQCDTGPQNGTKFNAASLMLYCPIEGGESITDATVEELARRTNSTVKTIDIVQYINEQPASFWKEMTISEDEDNISEWQYRRCVELGYFGMHEPINADKIGDLAKASLTQSGVAPESTGDPALQRCIVYLRDFGFLATFAPTCYAKVISAMCKQRSQARENEEATEVSTAVILGASPLLVKDSLFQKDIPKEFESSSDLMSFPKWLDSRLELNSGSDGDLDIWGEGKDVEKHRDWRLRQQHELWRNASLVDHIHTYLDRLDVFPENNQQLAHPKRLPICVVVPEKRDQIQERTAREKRRLELNRLQVQMALLAVGGELRSATHPSYSGAVTEELTSRCKEKLIEYEEIKRVANRAMGIALALSSPSSRGSTPTVISWDTYCTAWSIQQERDRECANWLEDSVPTMGGDLEDGKYTLARNDSDSGETDLNGEDDTVDLIIEWAKTQELDSYQESLLSCVVRQAHIQTGFESVHLPNATIDTMRTLVSLRLVCPEAFNTGILKQHSMSGALLFGPPGTGKTHMVKAIAKEAGARMISIKPSDILDGSSGETEKSINALFKLARLLKPCIIFIDEVDSLFGARLGTKDSWSRWRTDVLTQFTQEMDGILLSEVIVIGATNRPFDLDDAIIRRLPCRILIDLPDEDAREAILRILLKDEWLESDVDLVDLASCTLRFSGSDLKHLCVAAAFQSIKELTNVSWTTRTGKESSTGFSQFGVSSPAALNPDKHSPSASLSFTEGFIEPFSAMNNNQTQYNLKFQTRKLRKRHFTQALKQIRSSTSEKQGSLVELRRWNKQFGSVNQPNRAGGFADGRPTSSSDENDSSRGTDSSSKSDTPDPIIEWAKTQELNSYQEDLLSCIIRPAEIRTGFDSVHLPDATITTMRTLVSLRLVCPKAFNTGILKQHSMSGALLFGPPGTGKTHMMKAIAKESGARMISIKPSDISNKWVGETEKSIDALFKLARLLKPCIIFIDEFDALFGARVAAKEEMDGMQSSDVIVVGATNRPFDLDDAIIRRLPCRILVDLPDHDAREAILGILLKDEQLGPDVALVDLASLTPNFSGSDLKHLCIAAAFESIKERANVSWIKQKEGQSASISSAFSISSAAASDSDSGNSRSLNLAEGPAKPPPMPNDDSTQSQPESQTRTLTRKHFTQALKQVRASTSEIQSSLVELRRWNDQFGSGNRPNQTGGLGAPGLNLPGPNQASSRPWMNGSGIGTSGLETPGIHLPGLNPPGTNGPAGASMSNMNFPGINSSGKGAPGVSSHGLNFAPPVEGSYLRSLGVKF